MDGIPKWTIAAPLAGWLLLGGAAFGWGGAYLVLVGAGLLACVLAGVHHAERVAHRLGEPYGTLVLAIVITVIEVALIVTLMLAGGPAATALARDTVFAAVMVILNGMVGLCVLLGATRHGEQEFTLQGTSAALTTLAAIAVLALVLPNYTETTPGPFYSASQLAFIAVVSLVLYGTFVMVQAVRHRQHFLPANAPEAADEAHAPPPSNRAALANGALMVASLAVVVIAAKVLAPAVEGAVAAAGAPAATVGVVIAIVVLMPEGLAALRAARDNRLQVSLNLALGSALASIGLSIPTVALLSLANGWTLTLGLDGKGTALLLLSLFTAALSLGTGRTTVMQGTVHLVLFAVYLFTTVVP